MKIQISDKFLWTLYNYYEKTEEILELPKVLKPHTFKGILSMDDGYWKTLKRKKRKRQFRQLINYLKKKKYIKISRRENKKGILITPKGKRKALKAKFIEGIKPELKKRKDGRWYMVMYDIPEKRREYRESFRNLLIQLGFEKLQRSVWISPYEVSAELNEIIQVYKLEDNIRIFLIKEVEI